MGQQAAHFTLRSQTTHTSSSYNAYKAYIVWKETSSTRVKEQGALHSTRFSIEQSKSDNEKVQKTQATNEISP